MENKELKVVCPEGYEIDVENSSFECIKFRRKKLTYKKIAEKLFDGKETWHADDEGVIKMYHPYINTDIPTNCTSEQQVKKLLALNKLLNVAKYLNGDWVPDIANCDEIYQIELNCGNVTVARYTAIYNGVVGFKTKMLAKQAIAILGKDTIKLALTPL